MPIQWEYILSHLSLGLSLILGFVFLLTKTRLFHFSILIRKVSRREKVFYSIFFGIIGIVGTYGGLATIDGSANTRGVGIIVGGLIGGPIVGVGAGIISGIYRLWIGGINAQASALAAITEGLLAGLCAERFRHLPLRWVYAMLLGFILETMHLCMLPAFSPSFERGYQLAMSIFSSMLIINPLGIATFIAILDSVRSEQEAVEGKAARMAFKIAKQTLNILRQGFNEATATCTAQTIIDHVVSLDAVAVMASNKEIAFVTNKALPGSDFPDRSFFKAKIIAQLKERDKEIGTLIFYKSRLNSLTPVEIELIEGLAQLISMQIEVSKVEQQTVLCSQAEIKALQAQINPHFLFNALNTIVYYCRKQPEKARELLIDLGEFYRNNISHLDKWVDLRTEIHHVESYVKIESARFQGKLNVHYDIPADIHMKVPPFILQPIVENSIKHGLYPRKLGGTIIIQAVIINEVIHITIEDNGVGMSEDLINTILRDDRLRKSIGLSNVHQRLQTIYGAQYGLKISSCPGKGTVVSIFIPLKGVIHEPKSACSG